ncbi:hypothetical protein CEXT_809351 [Caerostris extrusa]|uniref:Uncharacterized protein n=1 Tax=Caerostris extrusa TaxID=172846 RepID=A0AAV4T0P5_CAEEX|nr:hypothetical protein CEXT_809351 [Caerostris extrusa]
MNVSGILSKTLARCYNLQFLSAGSLLLDSFKGEVKTLLIGDPDLMQEGTPGDELTFTCCCLWYSFKEEVKTLLIGDPDLMQEGTPADDELTFTCCCLWCE